MPAIPPEEPATVHSSPSAEALRASLESWRTSYQNDRPDCYLLGPEWDEFEKKKWAEYDQLELCRRRLSIATLHWQDGLKNNRKDNDLLRKRIYRPLEGKHLKFTPLYIRLDRYVNTYSSEKPYPWNLKESWSLMLASWVKFQELHDSKDSFRSLLSPHQSSSYQILKDWWSAAYCDPQLPQAAQSHFELKSRTTSHNFSLLPTEDFDENQIQTSVSLYHAGCFSLFLREFHPRTFKPFVSEVWLVDLQGIRYKISRLALAQRLSFAARFPDLAVRCSISPPVSTTASPLARAHPTVFLNEIQWTSTVNVREHPKYLWDADQMRTVNYADLPEPPQYMCVSHTWGRWRRKYLPAARIPGVPWRVPRNSRFDVTDLPRRLGSLGCRFIWFDLVCIPQNGSPEADDEIALQAAIFKGSQGCVAWLNDVESWEGVKSGLRWLGLKFLRNTTRPYESTAGRCARVADEKLEAAARAAFRPSELCQWGNHLSEPNHWFSSLWTLQEAILCPDLVLCAKDWTRLTDDWGTPISLKTLMVFLDEASQLCISDGPIDVRFTDAIRYMRELLFHQEHGRWLQSMRSWPLSSGQLDHLRNLTRLDNVLTVQSAVVICANTNVRCCGTRNRAPAIMSALGVTEWYVDGSWKQQGTKSRARAVISALGVGKWYRKSRFCSGSAQEPVQYIHQMYPLAFLQQLHQKFGASFFEAHTHWVRLDAEFKELLRNGEGIGTMLPFTVNQGWSSGITGDFEHIKIAPVDHESVRTWELRGDASVKITRAGILASSCASSPTETPGKGLEGIAGWATGADSYVSASSGHNSNIETTTDIVGLLGRIAREDGVLYAVSLYGNCCAQLGVLLYGLRSHDAAASSTRYLIKIGSLIVSNCTAPETSVVDWVVFLDDKGGSSNEYEALSYVWGSPDDCLPVIMDGSFSLSITKNLHSALQHLRSEKKPRTIWADAICINQQVRLMGDLYRNAGRVVAWLGPEADDSTLALELAESTARWFYTDDKKGALMQRVGIESWEL
ncbi:hypothetical protein RB595_004717 [Gaeumannomyces hyphopodioides]